MAKLSIDLTGKVGLTNDYYGDMDQTVSLNNRNFIVQQGEMVDGFFNPFMRRGFLSPSVSTLTSMSFSGGTNTALLTNSAYDSVNDKLYFAERGPQIFQASGMDTTTFALYDAVPSTDAATIITDMEIYQINGVRQLFFAYAKPSDTFTANASTDVISFGSIQDYAPNTPVTLTTTGTLPGGLSLATTYYVIYSGGSFHGSVAQLSTTPGGSVINITSTGSGVHTIHGSFGNVFRHSLSDFSTGSVLTDAANPYTTSGNVFMRVADNGFLYLFNGNVVNRFDGTVLTGGTNGTNYANVFVFPGYFTITDAVDYRENLYMVIHQATVDTTALVQKNFSTPCGVVIWDRNEGAADAADYAPLEGVKMIHRIYVAPNGSLRIITESSNRLIQIRQYNGSGFDIIRELGIGAYPQYHDSITNAGNLTIWGGVDGAIYAYGPVDPTTTYAYATVAAAKNEALAKIGQMKAYSSGDPAAVLTAMGALYYGSENTFSGSTGYRTDRQGLTIAFNDSSLETKKFYPFDKGTINSVAQQSLACNAYTPVVPLPYASTVHAINFMHGTGSSTGGTTQATVSIYFNGSVTPWASKTFTQDDISRGFKRVYVGKPWVQSIQFSIAYPTNVTLSDASDYHPMSAEVLFDPMPLLDQGRT